MAKAVEFDVTGLSNDVLF